jgi:hypothetical protein
MKSGLGINCALNAWKTEPRDSLKRWSGIRHRFIVPLPRPTPRRGLRCALNVLGHSHGSHQKELSDDDKELG